MTKRPHEDDLEPAKRQLVAFTGLPALREATDAEFSRLLNNAVMFREYDQVLALVTTYLHWALFNPANVLKALERAATHRSQDPRLPEAVKLLAQRIAALRMTSYSPSKLIDLGLAVLQGADLKHLVDAVAWQTKKHMSRLPVGDQLDQRHVGFIGAWLARTDFPLRHWLDASDAGLATMAFLLRRGIVRKRIVLMCHDESMPEVLVSDKLLAYVQDRWPASLLDQMTARIPRKAGTLPVVAATCAARLSVHTWFRIHRWRHAQFITGLVGLDLPVYVMLWIVEWLVELPEYSAVKNIERIRDAWRNRKFKQ